MYELKSGFKNCFSKNNIICHSLATNQKYVTNEIKKVRKCFPCRHKICSHLLNSKKLKKNVFNFNYFR